MQESSKKGINFIKRDFSLLLSVLLVAATFFLLFYIFSIKTPSDNMQVQELKSEPIISNKPLPQRDSTLEFVGDKLSEAEQNLRRKKTVATLRALEQAKVATSRAIEHQVQEDKKEKLQMVLNEVETTERDIHHGEIDEALKRIRQLEKEVETP